jgi:hypothetical protein
MKIKRFFPTKETLNRAKRQPTEWKLTAGSWWYMPVISALWRHR